MLLEQRAGQLDGPRHHLASSIGAQLEPHLAARDPRDVEQVVDQPHQVPHLALDDGALALAALDRHAAAAAAAR